MDNKNNLKNINDQNFALFMRGYDKGFAVNTTCFYLDSVKMHNYQCRLVKLCYTNTYFGLFKIGIQKVLY